MFSFQNEKYDQNAVCEVVKMIIDKTGGMPGHISLAERLQRLLDMPCEICRDGEVIREQQDKINRLSLLLRNALESSENQMGQSIMGTDLEDEIGITQEEYDEIME